jgi:tungstate transport system ATP-binding protein
MIMATHAMSQGQQLADRIGVLLNGRLVQTGDATDVFHSPQNQEVARFVGVENVIEGEVSDSKEGIVTVNIEGNGLQAVSDYPSGKAVYACIRSEDITLLIADDYQRRAARTSARNAFQGIVSRVTTVGPLSRVEMDCGFRLVALVTKMSAGEMDLQVGSEVCATFKATAVHIMERGMNQ